MMNPNENYDSYYSSEEMKDGELAEFSDTIHIGTRGLISHILEETKIEDILRDHGFISIMVFIIYHILQEQPTILFMLHQKILWDHIHIVDVF